MKTLTKYQPRNGDLTGPVFNSMTEASLWIVQQHEPLAWFTALISSYVELGETYAEFTARKDLEQAAEDEQREIEASQLEDWKSWKRS